MAPRACLANTVRHAVMSESISLCGAHVATLGGHADRTPSSASVIIKRSICKAVLGVAGTEQGLNLEQFLIFPPRGTLD